MATTKTTTLTFRIEPGLKDAVRAAAELEHRSIANMIEIMIRDYCGRKEIAIAETGRPAAKGSKKGPSASKRKRKEARQESVRMSAVNSI
jgi:hypothetical protein